ncbi:MAG: peptidase S8, partial [Chloroflexi bacterium]
MAPDKPVYRKLRAFAFDPGTTARLDTTMVNEVVIKVPWEELARGPKGEYVEVIDQDAQGRQLHEPVDLNDPAILAGGGLPPSDGNPQFRQQMLYAVAMRTIAAFEKALGRKAHWPPVNGQYQRRIKLYPHYMEDSNAYYLPQDGALFFGYFQAKAHTQYPGMVVFTCLSQDVIAHELAHPLLNGMHPHLLEETNPDVYAFHEGFCDLVALLQQFTLPEVLRHQLARSRGELTGPDTLLGIVAPQFGVGIGFRSGLRSVLGEIGEDGVWRQKPPDPQEYRTVKETHQRGSILVRAVFDALNKVYHSRVADLWRIASEGTGVLQEGYLHPDLVNRLAVEAARTAQVVLEICVRALDYCPAVDITFSDYLRAILTADFDLHPGDPLAYRVAFVEAFRRYGIFPADIGTLSLEGLLWPRPESGAEEQVVREFILKELALEYTSWNLPKDREELYHVMQEKAKKLEEDLKARRKSLKGLLGEINPARNFEVKSIWPRQHSGPNGETFSQWVIEIVQTINKGAEKSPHLASCTLLVNAETGLVRYSIHKATSPGAARSKRSLLERSSQVTVPKPRERKLRVYSFDPSLSIQVDTAPI